jgi:hypothetical protein
VSTPPRLPPSSEGIPSPASRPGGVIVSREVDPHLEAERDAVIAEMEAEIEQVIIRARFRLREIEERAASARAAIRAERRLQRDRGGGGSRASTPAD